MWQGKWQWWLFLGVFCVVVLVLILANRTGTSRVADEATQWHLRKIAESVYEYYALTGTWPSNPNDLRKTSLAKLPHDIPMIENGNFVVIWGRDLKPNPADNAKRALVYAHMGPIRHGWKWVCWGDFRMEYMSEEQLQTVLQGAAK